MAVVVPQTFETVRLSDVELHPANPREGDVGAIHESIVANGFYGALIVQRSTGRVLAGNHRAQAAREAGLTELPALVVDCDNETATRILLVDNRTNDVATYDESALFGLLTKFDDLTGTGYTFDDLEDLRRSLMPFEPDDEKKKDAKPVVCPACGHEFTKGAGSDG